MERAEKSLDRMKDLGEDIARLRDDVEQVIARSTKVADDLRPRLAAVKTQIDKLGPSPAANAPAEAAAIAAERARLNAEASALDGAIKTLELTWVRARQTIDKITDLRLAIFTRSIMERMSSPLLPSLWSDVLRDAPPVGRLLRYIARDWWSTVTRQLGWFLVGCVLSAALFAALKIGARRVTAVRLGNGHIPTFFERAATASWVAPVRALPAVLAALAAYGVLDALNLLYYPSQSVAAAVLRAIFIFAGVSALIGALLERDPNRRLVALSDPSAIRISRLLRGMAAAYAIDLALTAIGRTLYVPLSMSVVQSLVAALVFAGLLIGILLTPFEAHGALEGTQTDRLAPRWAKVPLWVLAGLIIGAAALGYVALARFAAQQLVMTGVVALVTGLLFLAIRAFTRDPREQLNPVGELLQSRFGLDEPRRRQLARLTEFVLSLSLCILAVPVLLLQWGFSEADIRDWFKAALFGFEIGQFRISLARILIGLVLFTALLFATRLVQRWLRESVLSPTRFDSGIANSIDTAVGYFGTGLAALVAVAYAGFDVTNLAIVAGALSVGIGFGLQSIVNNFVSGLILLIERPIKVGDWVVVGSEQGTVRKISVRSTEIDTFDRASLIVPNSELIMGRVLNWTHRNAMGRIAIKLTTNGEADPRHVCALLEAAARASNRVLTDPPVRATLDSITPAALEFTVRAYLSDILRGTEVQSEIRIAALEALRGAGVGGVTAPPSPAPVAAGHRT